MNYKIFSVDGSQLAERIAMHLEDAYGKVLGEFKVDRFSDGELSPQFMESIRDKKVFLVSSTTSPEKIMTLLLSIDAAKRASASAKKHRTIALYYSIALVLILASIPWPFRNLGAGWF